MEDIKANSESSVTCGKKSQRWSELWPIALLLLVPHLLWGPVPGTPGSLVFGFPHVHLGDEPHYLLMINSLVNEVDLDLANNYAAVQRGANQAGEVHAGSTLDHHVAWLESGRLVIWDQAYENLLNQWRGDDLGQLAQTISNSPADVRAPPHEYSWHQSGMPILLALLLFPLRGTSFIEPAALVCSGIVTIAAMFFFHALIRPYYTNRQDLLLVTIIAFLGTPVWHYGRTLFTEPYLLACAVGAYTLYLRGQRPFTAGCLLGVGILIKRTMILLFFPLLADAILKRDWVGALKCIGTLIGSLMLLAAQNKYFFGCSYGWDPQIPLRNPLTGAIALTFSSNAGLVPFAPAALAALIAWPSFFRRNLRDAAVLSSAFLVYFGFCASLPFGPGCCYGPRYLVPVLPFLFSAFPAITWESGKALPVRWLIVLLSLLSVWINMIGAVSCGNAWGVHPVSLLYP